MRVCCNYRITVPMHHIKHLSLCAALLLAQLTVANAQPPLEPAGPASSPTGTSISTAEPAAAEPPASPPKELKAGLAGKQVPQLVMRWDCGDCAVNEKVFPLVEKTYASKAAAKGSEVSSEETAEIVVTKYRQRPPGARVMFGFMAGKDILETRVTYRGKEFAVGDYSANAWQGMDSLCEAVAQITLDRLLANL